MEDYFSNRDIQQAYQDNGLQLIVEPIMVDVKRGDLIKINLRLKNNTKEPFRTSLNEDTMSRSENLLYVEITRPSRVLGQHQRILSCSGGWSYEPGLAEEDLLVVHPGEEKEILNIEFEDHGRQDWYIQLVGAANNKDRDLRSNVLSNCFDLEGIYNIKVYILSRDMSVWNNEQGKWKAIPGAGLLVSNNIQVRVGAD